jgi:hypothetical protein
MASIYFSLSVLDIFSIGVEYRTSVLLELVGDNFQSGSANMDLG